MITRKARHRKEQVMATEKSRGAPRKQEKKPKAPSTAKAAKRAAAKKARDQQPAS